MLEFKLNQPCKIYTNRIIKAGKYRIRISCNNYKIVKETLKCIYVEEIKCPYNHNWTATMNSYRFNKNEIDSIFYDNNLSTENPYM